MTDYFRFVSSDAKGTGPKLEHLVAFSERTKYWDAIFNDAGDNIIGYRRKLIEGGSEYVFEIRKPGTEFTVSFSCPAGELCRFEGTEVQRLYGIIEAAYQSGLDNNYQDWARAAKNVLANHKG